MRVLINLEKGFSLVELLVSMAILIGLMLMMTILLGEIQSTWTFAEDRTSQFREARVAFDQMTRNISQASLNTYYDLVDEDDDGLPDGYKPTSELHFAVVNASSDLPSSKSNGGQIPYGHGVFFQAPIGYSDNYKNLTNLFNAMGYFVAWGSDERFRPGLNNISSETRFRLFEFRPPAELNQVYQDGFEERINTEDQVFNKWYRLAVTGAGSGSFGDYLNPVAKNIILLVISPREGVKGDGGSRDNGHSEIAKGYLFDSNNAKSGYIHQLPPLLNVTMIAIDEESAIRLEELGGHTALSSLKAFKDVSNFQSNLQAVESELQNERLNYKVFSTTISIRASKWSPVETTIEN